MSDLVAAVGDVAAIAGVVGATVVPFWVLHRGQAWRISWEERRERRALARSRRRVRVLVETGRRTPRTERSLHNDFDAACCFWWADRRPSKHDSRNRDLDGSWRWTTELRCVVCRPFTEEEQDHALAVGSRYPLPLPSQETTHV